MRTSTFSTAEVIAEIGEIETEGITPPSTLSQIQSQREHINSDTEAEIEGTMGDRHETPEGRGKGPEIHFDSMQAMLNDLTRGQIDLLIAVQQLNLSAQMLQHSMSTIGANVAGGPSGSGGHRGGGAGGS